MRAVSAPTVVIIAAGEGTRMRSALPKVLHPLCGRPLILWPVAAAREAGAGKVVVVDNPKRRLGGLAARGRRRRRPGEPQRHRGRGGRGRRAHIDADATVVVINGDVPLITRRGDQALVEAHEESGAAGDDGDDGARRPGQYGRVVRDDDGNVERVVEAKGAAGDATPEQLAIREVNTGVYAFDGGGLLDALEQLDTDNAQGELYLPDVLPQLREAGKTIAAHVVTDHDAHARRQRPRRARAGPQARPAAHQRARTRATA